MAKVSGCVSVWGDSADSHLERHAVGAEGDGLVEFEDLTAEEDGIARHEGAVGEGPHGGFAVDAGGRKDGEDLGVGGGPGQVFGGGLGGGGGGEEDERVLGCAFFALWVGAEAVEELARW